MSRNAKYDFPLRFDKMYNFARSLFISFFLLALVQADLNCRPKGPVVPKPTSIQGSRIFQDASSKLKNALDNVISGDVNAGWAIENSSFSLAVISADQADPGTPIWQYHHLGSANVNGTKDIDRDTQYLIGSISKVVADYVLLKSGIDIDAPITDFLSTLNTSDTNIPWRNITMRMLASHLSGVPTNRKSLPNILAGSIADMIERRCLGILLSQGRLPCRRITTN